jgi:hypothetical protein
MLTPATGLGDPMVKDSRSFFNDHGTIRQVTESEFHVGQSRLLRLYSGLWLFLHLVPAAVRLGWNNAPSD